MSVRHQVLHQFGSLWVRGVIKHPLGPHLTPGCPLAPLNLLKVPTEITWRSYYSLTPWIALLCFALLWIMGELAGEGLWLLAFESGGTWHVTGDISHETGDRWHECLLYAGYFLYLWFVPESAPRQIQSMTRGRGQDEEMGGEEKRKEMENREENKREWPDHVHNIIFLKPYLRNNTIKKIPFTGDTEYLYRGA